MDAGTVHDACSARRVDPDELQLAADVAEAAVGRGGLARVERPDDDMVAGTNRLDAVPDRRDRSRHLVADHHRRRDSRIHRAVRDVEVCSADAAERDLESHLSVAGRHDGGVADREPTAAFVDQSSGAHTIEPTTLIHLKII